MNGKARLLARRALLLSIALALSRFEQLLPLQAVFPFPGMKPGLANIVTLAALYLLDGKSAFALLLLRCVLSSALGGGITAFLFSAAGGSAAMLAMLFARRLPAFSIYGVSMCGAAAHGIGQIAVAMMLARSVYPCAYLPFLLLCGLFTGFATGAAASGIIGALQIRRAPQSEEPSC